MVLELLLNAICGKSTENFVESERQRHGVYLQSTQSTGIPY